MSKSKQALKTLKTFIPVVEERIAEYFERIQAKVDDRYTDYASFYTKEMASSTLDKAKRLRASFVYYSYKMHGGKDESLALDVATAIEMIHAAWLILDDFNDKGFYRRGQLAFHKKMQKYHKEQNLLMDPVHYGNSIASNASVQLSYEAMNLLQNLDIDPALILKLNNQIVSQVIETAHGQLLDINNSHVQRDKLTEQDIINVLYWKTGIYTYDNPVQTGAILAGASEKELKKLQVFGHKGGVSFQIQDDILGTFGDEGQTGKSASDDIQEGKQTLLVWYAYANGTAAQKKEIDRVLGDRASTDEDIAKIREIFKETGSLAYSNKVAQEYVKEAKQSLIDADEGQWEKESLDYLLGIADFMIERKF